MSERFIINTFGCQMNEYDSLRIARLLESRGCAAAGSYEDASLIILNTCTVRQKAEDKIYSELGRIKKYKARNPGLLIGFGGCLAQQEGKKLLKRFPQVDFVFGTRALPRIPGMLADARAGRRLCDTGMDAPLGPFYAGNPYAADRGQVSAFVTVMQGCDNFCSYCIVPHVRGREWSRPAGDIVGEVRRLVDGGVRDVMLLGQNVNAYGKHLRPAVTFAELIARLDAIDGLARIRFTTSHPKDLTDDLIAAFAGVPKLCEHMHLPVQSGSDRILQHMNRRYTRQAYVEKVARLREARPDIAITSDIIVGYPGETERDFLETVDLVEKIQFDDLFIFHYTDRKGTAASEVPDSIAYGVKIERLRLLGDIQHAISLRKNSACIGHTVEVLFEKASKRGAGSLAGKTRAARVVNCPGPASMIGRLAPVVIDNATVHSLSGTLA